MQEDFRIQFERSGGLMGRVLQVDLDAASMSAEEVDTLRRLIQEAHLLEMDSVPDSPNHRDTFQYSIVWESGGDRKSVALGESQVPDRCRPLMDWLVRKAQGR